MSQLILIFLALGQLDLLLVRLFSDIAANAVTTSLYLHGKTYDPVQFERDFGRTAGCGEEIGRAHV